MISEIKKLRTSFKCAIVGLLNAIKNERNFRIHIIAALYVTFFANILDINIVYFCILFLCFSLMLSLELINTAIERLSDKAVDSYSPIIKSAKDIAAAAVLICAIFCIIIAIIIFGQYIDKIKIIHLFFPLIVSPFALIFIFKRR